MTNGDSASWQNEVQSALKRYHRARELETHAASAWPAVLALTETGLDVVAAIRRVLAEAIAELEAHQAQDARLLRLHYLQGQSMKAVAADQARDVSLVYKRCNAVLAELALLVAERNRGSTRAAAPQRFLPQQPVFGFDGLAAELVSQFHDPVAPPLLVIEGMGGLGKTTLAQLVAAQCADEPAFAGVLWTSAKHVDFDVWAGIRRPARAPSFSADELVSDLARELHIPLRGSLTQLRSEVVARCRQQPYLIVFDNLETVEDMAALAPLVELLAGRSRILITTRDRALEALPADLGRTYVALDELDRLTSYQILRSAAQLTGARALASASDDDLGRIYAVTGGNPLALRLVAGQAYGRPWERFVDELVANRPPSSSSTELYEYLYRRAWQQLSADAKLVLFAMHRCPAGVDYDLLCRLSGVAEDAFHAATNELLTRMLLQFDGRYTIHRLTYSFLRVAIVGWSA